MTTISTHVLDTTTGRPATGVAVTLERDDGDGWRPLGAGQTDEDGRIIAASALAGDGGTGPGDHRLTFATGAYLRATGGDAFFPQVVIAFTVTTESHLHVPLLLSRYGYSTYRGS